MNWHRSLGALLVFISVAAADAATDVSIVAKNITTSIPALRESGFDWVFLPYKKPFDPQKPELLPFDSTQPLRGVFTPDQLAAVMRALPGNGAGENKARSVTIPKEAALVVPSKGDKGAFSVSAISLSEAKLEVTISGSDPAWEQVATVTVGDTIVLSFQGTESDAVSIYLLTITKG